MSVQYPHAGPPHVRLVPPDTGVSSPVPARLAHRMAHKPTRTRGRAAKDRQLGRVQLEVLHWLLASEYRIRFAEWEAREFEADLTSEMVNKARRDFRILETRGIPWQKVHEHLGVRPSAVSEALASLVGRGLVVKSETPGGRTTHAVLTRTGERAARLYPHTERSLRSRAIKHHEKTHGPYDNWSQELRGDFESWFSTTVDRMRNFDGNVRLSLWVGAHEARKAGVRTDVRKNATNKPEQT